MVTEAQLQAIAGDVTTAEYAAPQEVTSDEAKAAREWLLGYLEHYELVSRTEARRITGGWKLGIYCPLTETDAQPHDEGGETSTDAANHQWQAVLQMQPQHLRKAGEEYGCVQTGNVTAQPHPVFARTRTGRGCCVWNTADAATPTTFASGLGGGFSQGQPRLCPHHGCQPAAACCMDGEGMGAASR